jgi:hypothetical protein
VAAPRYYVNQWFDLYTHNFAYTGVRATGRGAGTYLFAGPRWNGTVPKGITKVFRAETDFVGTLTRTQLNGPDDIPALQALQAKFQLIPLSRFEGTKPPRPAPPVNWPAWDAAKVEGIGFIGYLNALLPFMPTVPSERATMARFARIGIGPGRPFDANRLDPATRRAIEVGVAAAAADLRSQALAQKSSKGFFGTRDELGPDYLTYRSMGAMLGIYGNSSAEAFYASQQTGPDGKVLDGRRKWVLRFPAGQLPPVSEFWSITMYNLPQRLLWPIPSIATRSGIAPRGSSWGPMAPWRSISSMRTQAQTKSPTGCPLPRGPSSLWAVSMGQPRRSSQGSGSCPPCRNGPSGPGGDQQLQPHPPAPPAVDGPAANWPAPAGREGPAAPAAESRPWPHRSPPAESAPLPGSRPSPG